MERPGSYHSIEEDLAVLRAGSIGQVLSLTERALDPGPFRTSRIVLHHLPVPDFDAPTVGQVETLCRLVDAAAGRGEASLVHCLAGLGRTGTIAACYLAHKGDLDGRAAILAARAVEPGYIQSPRQEDLVISFAASRRTGER